MIQRLKSLRKLGLDHHDLPTMLRNITIMLEHLTLDVDPRNKRPVGILSYICLITYFLSHTYIYVVSMIWFVFVKCRETGDLLTALLVFSLSLISQMSNLKFATLMAYRKNLRDVIGEFLACDALSVPDTRFALKINTKMREVKKRAMILFIVFFANGTVYVVKPFIMSGLEDSFRLYGFENVSRTSVSSPLYPLVFIMDTIAVYGVCYLSSSITSMFIVFSGYIEAQMLALSHELINVWEDAIEHCNSNSTRIISHIRRPSRTFRQLEDVAEPVFLFDDYTAKIDSFKTAYKARTNLEEASCSNISKQKNGRNSEDALNKFIRKRLEDISKSHSINVVLVNKVEVIFRIAIALEFLVLSIGLIVCLLGGLEHTYIELPIILMTVGIDCVTGQRIIDASQTFENAVYDSKWENFDVINRKIILLMLRESQKTLTLSAGAVATLSLEFFKNVLRTIYSVYTTFRSTVK